MYIYSNANSGSDYFLEWRLVNLAQYLTHALYTVYIIKYMIVHICCVIRRLAVMQIQDCPLFVRLCLFIVPVVRYNLLSFFFFPARQADRFTEQIRNPGRKTRVDRTHLGRAFYKLFYNSRLAGNYRSLFQERRVDFFDLHAIDALATFLSAFEDDLHKKIKHISFASIMK